MLRKWFIAFLIIVMAGVCAPAMATICYCDYGSGNDSTGDGTYGNPYQTVEGCSINVAFTGGDEIRVSAAGAHTTLTGTLTFTNGSATISTSADLTGELSAGDYIGKDIANEGWWNVASLDASSITLSSQYWGASGAGITGYKATADPSSSLDDLTDGGTSVTSRLKISGGWDLSTQTQSGSTFIINSSGYPVDCNNQDYLEFSDFVFLGLASPIYRPGHGCYFHDMIYCYATSPLSVTTAVAGSVVEDIIVAGSINNGVYASNSTRCIYDNIRILSPGTGSADVGLVVGDATNTCIFRNFYIYNSYDDHMSISGNGSNHYYNFDLDVNIYANSYGIRVSSGGAYFNTFSIDNTTGHAIFVSDNFAHTYFSNITFGASVGGLDVLPFESSMETSHNTITFRNYDGVAGDDRIFFASEDTSAPLPSILKDTADARSGSCLKFVPQFTPWLISYEIGTYKITSESGDITLSIYLKDEATFNGQVFLWATKDGQVVVDPTEKTMTTSYAENTLVVPEASLVENDYLTLWIGVNGTAGYVFVDDFSASQ